MLIDIVDRKLIRSFSSSPEVIIPCDIEILGSYSFSSCKSIESVFFEDTSQLTRIESRAFSHSSLHWIVIPRSVRFIDGSAFDTMELSAISIENGNERFAIREALLIDVVDHTLIHTLSQSSSVLIPPDIEILGSKCFSFC
jgi:hypothetical protein